MCADTQPHAGRFRACVSPHVLRPAFARHHLRNGAQSVPAEEQTIWPPSVGPFLPSGVVDRDDGHRKLQAKPGKFGDAPARLRSRAGTGACPVEAKSRRRDRPASGTSKRMRPVISSLPGAFATKIRADASSLTCKFAAIFPSPKPAGCHHSLYTGVAAKSSRGMRSSRKYTSFTGRPVLNAQRGLWKAQYCL
jgi:hypothetical protein